MELNRIYQGDARALARQWQELERWYVRFYDVLHKEKISAVYFLMSGDQVVYIGQSSNLYRRIHQHRHNPRLGFDKVYYIAAPKNQLQELERKAVEAFRPVMNGCLH